MPDLIEQRVIGYIAGWYCLSADSLSAGTTFESIGIIAATGALLNIIMELEDSFSLTYVDGDTKGIVTIGDAVALIKRKLGIAASKGA